MSNSQSSSNLDDILKELEERFSSATSHTPPTKSRKKKAKFPLQKLLGALAFVVIMGGIASAAYLTQTSQDVRQQASSTLLEPIVQRIQGFDCSGTTCTTADDWQHETGPYFCNANNQNYSDKLGCENNCKYSNNVPGTCTGTLTPVNCAPDVKVVRYYCPNGLDATGRCLDNFLDVTGAVAAQTGSPMAPGKSVNMDPLMPDKCGTYQFDFQEPGTPDYSAASACGAVVYQWSGNCDGTTPPGVTPPPVPACTVDVVMVIPGSTNELPNDNGVFRVSPGETFTLRARVTNIQNGTVDRVRFVAQDPVNVTPDSFIDYEVPYQSEFTNTSLERSTIRANVRFNGIDDPVCSAEVGIRVKSTCDEICNVDTDCLASQNLKCLDTTEGKRCRVPEYPDSPTCTPASPTPTPTPTNKPGVCLSITLNNQTNPGSAPKAGDKVNFICGQVAGQAKYRFRLIEPSGTIRDLSQPYTQSANSTIYTVPANTLGKFYAQCSVCSGTDVSTCSEWESVPGVPTPTPTTRPTSTPTPTPTSTPRILPSFSPILSPRPSGVTRPVESPIAM